MAKKQGAKKKTKSDVPVAFAKWMFEQARTVGLSRDDLQAEAGFARDSETAWRLENGKPEASAKAANAMRAILVEKYRLDIPHVPVGDHDWTPPKLPDDGRPKADDTDAEITRKNMIRFRQEAGLDQIAASDRSGIPYETLQAFERGEKSPTNAELRQLAPHYGRRIGDFLDHDPPPLDRSRIPAMSVTLAPEVSAEDRARVEAIRAEIDEKYRADKRALLDHIDKARRKDR